MSSPDRIDERFDELVHELRRGRVTAGPELRDRVRAIAEREPEPPAASRLGFGSRFLPARRRLVWIAAPAAAIAAAAIGVGLFTGGGGDDHRAARVAHGSLQTLEAQKAAPLPRTPRAADRSALPPSGTRHQLYAVDMELQVDDLSAATKRALNLTRSFGGFVRSVDYGSAQKSGTADLVLRIPIGKVEKAVVELSALGTILDQHVAIQDITPRLDARFRAIQGLRVRIADLKAKIAASGLTDEERAALEATLARREAALAALRLQQRQQLTKSSFGTVSLYLQRKQSAAVVPSKPGRIGQALHEIGLVLVREAEILLYVLLIGAPFLLLAALLWAGRRTARRRSEEQLLAR